MLSSLWSWVSGGNDDGLKGLHTSHTAEEIQLIRNHFNQQLQLGHSHQGLLLTQTGFRGLCTLPPGSGDTELLAALFCVIAHGEQGVRLRDVLQAQDQCREKEGGFRFSYCVLQQLQKSMATKLGTQGCGSGDQLGLGFDALMAASAQALQTATGMEAPAQAVQAVALGAMQLAAKERSSRQTCGSSSSSSTPTPTTIVGGAGSLTFKEFTKWAARCPAVHNIITGMVLRIGALEHPGSSPIAGPSPRALQQDAPLCPHQPTAHDPLPSAPLCVGLEQARMGQLVVSHPAWALLLSQCLPPDLRDEWRLLYSSELHGKSFNTLIGRVFATPGPTLLLLRDAQGSAMGGFGPEPWHKQGNFFGSHGTCIFSTEPALQVFPSTGYNENFQWCGVGFKELPNGLGFGGAGTIPGHFGLFLDANIDRGHSKPVSTFGNWPLTKDNQQAFEVESVECWLLRPPEEEQSAHMAGGSVLDRATDRHMMGLMGIKADYSVGEREKAGVPAA